jgi:hypothetical protein
MGDQADRINEDGQVAELLGEEYDLYNGSPPHELQDTSALAAIQAMPNISRQQRRVYLYIRNVGPATDDELEVALHISHQAVSARRRELVLKGLLRNSGKRRRTRRNRLATVWEVGLELTSGDKGTPAVVVPSKEELRLAIKGLQDAMRCARSNGHKFMHGVEIAKLGNWLKAIAR